MPHQGQQGFMFESEGHRLLGTLFLARGDEPKPTALLLHGIPGIEKNFDLAHALRDHGWNSLIFHYRGAWGSGGDYGFETQPRDVRAALDALTGGEVPQVDPNRLVLIGHSLGGWAAVLSAVAEPRVRAVAVYAAVTDPRQLRFTPASARDYTDWLQGISPERFVAFWERVDDSLIPVEQVHRLAPRPLLVIHGEADEVIPLAQGEALYERAGETKRLVVVSEGNHALSWHRPQLRETLLDWLDSLDL